jgi:hypothetical protein
MKYTWNQKEYNQKKTFVLVARKASTAAMGLRITRSMMFIIAKNVIISKKEVDFLGIRV